MTIGGVTKRWCTDQQVTVAGSPARDRRMPDLVPALSAGQAGHRLPTAAVSCASVGGAPGAGPCSRGEESNGATGGCVGPVQRAVRFFVDHTLTMP